MGRLTGVMAAAVIAAALGCAGEAGAAESEKKTGAKSGDAPAKRFTADEMVRVQPGLVRERVRSGKALLVCSYTSDLAFRAVALEGAIPLGELEKRLPGLPREQEIYFYCA